MTMRLPRSVSNTPFAILNTALIILSMSALASSAFAQAVGTITRLEGTAQIQRGANTTPAALSEPVQLHDKITTGANTYLTVSMLGGSAMTLASNTTLTVDDSANIGGTEAPTRVGLLAGQLHTLISGAMRTGSPTAFEVHTPNAVGAVRGTEWDEAYEEGTPKSDKYQNCLQYTEVWVEEGVVHVSNPGVPGDPGKDVGQGQYVKVPCGYIPMGAEAAGVAGAGAGAGWKVPLIGAGIIAGSAGIAAGVLAGTSGSSSSGQPPSPSK
jgi:hypothetical protein